MTANEAFEQQLITQIGSACLTIAKQAAAVTELQNQLAAEKEIGDALRKGATDAEKKMAEMQKQLDHLTAPVQLVHSSG